MTLVSIEHGGVTTPRGFLAGAAREDLVGLAAGARFESRKKGETLYAAADAVDIAVLSALGSH